MERKRDISYRAELTPHHFLERQWAGDLDTK